MLEDAIADRAAVASLQDDRIADFDIAQHGELRIAMRGDHAVSDCIRRRRSVDVTRAECHRASARARQHDEALVLARKLDACNRPGVGPSPRLHALFAVERSRPRSLEQYLRNPRFRIDQGTICEAQRAGNRERTDEDEALHDQLRTAIAAAIASNTIPITMYIGAGVAVPGRDPSTPPQPWGKFTGTARVSQFCSGTPDGV